LHISQHDRMAGIVLEDRLPFLTQDPRFGS
jgi:hypothetical protein